MTGTELRALREAAGLTQAQVATRLGTRQSVISEMEGGTRPITVAVLTRLAPVFGKRVEIQLVEAALVAQEDAAKVA